MTLRLSNARLVELQDRSAPISHEEVCSITAELLAYRKVLLHRPSSPLKKRKPRVFGHDGLRLGPLTLRPRRSWYCAWLMGEYCGLFRNRKGIIPGRWGFYILGLEFGSRNPGNPFGTWLKRKGLWPW